MGDFAKLASGIYLEGLAVDYRRNTVWYSDVIAGGVHGLLADGRVESFNLDRKWTGGVMLNDDGAVLSSGAGGIMWNNPDTGRSGWLLDEIDGKPISGINEMAPDGTGGIIFGTCDIEMIARGEAPRPSAIYRLTVDGDVILLAPDIGFCNGIMLSRNRDQFYCNNTFACTYIFDVTPDLALTNRRVLLEKQDCDGMALDADGNIWITGFQTGHLTRLRPDGTALPPIETPASAVTQVRFGGPDMRDIYINTVPADGGENLKNGVPLSGRNSFLYRGRSKVPGLPIAPAGFRLD